MRFVHAAGAAVMVMLCVSSSVWADPTAIELNVDVTPGNTTQVNIAVNAPGSLHVLVPESIAINEPFKMDVWYEPTKNVSGAVANVFFDRGINVTYEPAEIALTPFKRQSVKVTIKKASSGLARLVAYSGCCPTRVLTVISDFKGRVRRLEPATLESRRKQPVSVFLEDNQNRPLLLDADLDLTVAAFNAEVSADGNKWQSTITSKIKKGSARSEFFYVRPTPVDVSNGYLSLTGYSDGGNVAFSDDLAFLITSPWWLKLLMAMFGAFLYALYKRLNATPGGTEAGTFLRSLGAALIAGIFAYQLVAFNLFGIQIDTTSLQSFVLIGLLTAYVGVEPLLEKLVQRRNQRAAETSSADQSKAAETKSAAAPSVPAAPIGTAGASAPATVV